MSYVGTLQESFGWNAARVETVSTKKIFLDKGNFCTKSNRRCSSYESSCTAANDDQVVLFLKDVRQLRASVHRTRDLSNLSVSHCRTNRSSVRRTSWEAGAGPRLQTFSGSRTHFLSLHSEFLLQADRVWHVYKQPSARSCSPKHSTFYG